MRAFNYPPGEFQHLLRKHGIAPSDVGLGWQRDANLSLEEVSKLLNDPNFRMRRAEIETKLGVQAPEVTTPVADSNVADAAQVNDRAEGADAGQDAPPPADYREAAARATEAEPPPDDRQTDKRQASERKMEFIRDAIEQGNDVYLSTATRQTRITPSTWAAYDGDGRPLVKVGSDGSLMMMERGRYVDASYSKLTSDEPEPLAAATPGANGTTREIACGRRADHDGPPRRSAAQGDRRPGPGFPERDGQLR